MMKDLIEETTLCYQKLSCGAEKCDKHFEVPRCGLNCSLNGKWEIFWLDLKSGSGSEFQRQLKIVAV